ncbi:DUF6913 domain-containing protein [Parabacteroides bouchesdurhonensis]|uniref:DUF6913 domain-containing protein n=1 Tax=Parabacteroides bouchesdurhonensis TaxID=1936995 RepID=UPI000C850CA0|nr:hypothetical protein [Parabacteroides bouchesdurhonensis]
MILTNYFIKKKIHSLIKKDRHRSFRGLREAHLILVIYDAKDQKDIEPCLETFRMMHKQVRTLVYNENPVVADNESGLLLCPKKDLNIWGYPTEEICSKLKDIRADILIDLTNSDNYAMQYLMLQHPCNFKVGAKRNEQDLYDLSITVTEKDDIKHLFGHILFYLQTIRSK